MPNFSNISITIRPCILYSSTIIGYARVRIDHEILLKEIPIFHCDGNLSVIIASDQIAICPMEMDMTMLNHEIWKHRVDIEQAIFKEMKGKLRIAIDN